MHSKSESQSVFLFIIILCSACALILAGLATSLLPYQKKAEEEDLGEQMLIGSKILSREGYFLVKNSSGNFIPAVFDQEKNILIPSNTRDKAASSQILTVLNLRIEPFLVDVKGDLYTFEEKKINYSDYLKMHKKTGYADLDLKLIYKIYSNTYPEKTTIGYVIPINGFGLWGPLYGYLAIESDGETVIGTTWYDQVETAGLGAEIAETEWQEQFYQKSIFLTSQEGSVNFETSPIGIQVVKGKVSQVYGSTNRAKSAVDGVSGATITSKGVTNAYRTSLEPYRPFLVKIHKEEKNAS